MKTRTAGRSHDGSARGRAVCLGLSSRRGRPGTWRPSGTTPPATRRAQARCRSRRGRTGGWPGRSCRSSPASWAAGGGGCWWTGSTGTAHGGGCNRSLSRRRCLCGLSRTRPCLPWWRSVRSRPGTSPRRCPSVEQVAHVAVRGGHRDRGAFRAVVVGGVGVADDAEPPPPVLDCARDSPCRRVSVGTVHPAAAGGRLGGARPVP
jgi:hypothetical protein